MDVLTIVPTLNEVRTIRQIIEMIRDHNYSVLVVDDGSTDGTLEAIHTHQAFDEDVHVIQRGKKLGLGSAYREGFAWSSVRNFDVVCGMDADLSHDPADLPRLIQALETADVAVGSRYVPGGTVVGWSRRRRWLSAAGNAYARALTGCPVRDLTSGFRAFRTGVASALTGETKSEGYAFQIEMALGAWQSGQKIVEVPITFIERSEGMSKMSNAIVIEALRKSALWGWQIRRGAWPNVTMTGIK